MKKLLALVLALVMTLSLCVTSNAAYDGETFDYDEAVEVMSAIGVFQGDENGKFNPDGILTREQAAKIVTYMLLGKTAADALVTIAAPFADVEATRWSAGSIAYCYNEGILAGVGEGKFAPTAELTGLAFAKMMLTALGYDAEVEGLVGSNWSINAAKLALTVGLTDDLDDVALTAPMTREQAAKMALNTMTATMVGYPNASVVKVGDIEVSTSAKAADVENHAAAGNSYNNVADGKMQFCEKYFAKLKLNTTNGDDMLRPANTWNYKGEKVGTYSVKADETLVVDKYNKTYLQMAQTINAKYTVAGNVVCINGAGAVSATGNNAKVGDVLEIYENSVDANVIDKIVVTQYGSAKVTGAVQTKVVDGVDYVRVPGVINSFTNTDYVHGYKDLAKNDVVYTVTTASGTTEYYLNKAESFEGKLTAYSKVSGSTAPKYTIGGEKYTINQSVANVDSLDEDGYTTYTGKVYNTTYKYYTDNNGYIVYAVAVENELSDYVVIQSIGVVKESGVTTDKSVEARLVFMDGTTKVVSVDKLTNATAIYVTGTPGGGETTIFNVNDIAAAVAAKVDNEFYTYEIDSDGNYELTYVNGTLDNKVLAQASGANKGVVNGATKLTNVAASVVIDDETVFVVAEKDNGKTFKVYTGKENVPSMTTAHVAYVTKGGHATFVYVDSYASKAVAGDSVYFLSGTASSFETVKKEDKTTYSFGNVKAIVNGEVTTVKVQASGSPLALSCTGFGSIATGTLFTPTYNTDGVITSLTVCYEDVNVAYGYDYNGTTLVTNAGATGAYKCSDSTVVFFKDEDGNYTKDTFANYEADDNDAIYVVVKDATKLATGEAVVDFAVIMDMADLGLQTLKYNDGSTNRDLDEALAVQTVAAANNKTYYVTATVSAADKVEYCTTINGAYNATASSVTVGTIANGDTETIYVKVTNKANTDLYTIYTVNFKTDAVLGVATPANTALTATGTGFGLAAQAVNGTDITANAVTGKTGTITVTAADTTNTTVTYCDTIDGEFKAAGSTTVDTITMGAVGTTKTVYVKVANDHDGSAVIYTVTLTAIADD